MATASSPKGVTLSDLKVDDDRLSISFSCNNTAEQKVQGTFKGLLEVGEDTCIMVNVADGKPYEAVPLKWVKVVERIRRPEIISFTGQ